MKVCFILITFVVYVVFDRSICAYSGNADAIHDAKVEAEHVSKSADPSGIEVKVQVFDTEYMHNSDTKDNNAANNNNLTGYTYNYIDAPSNFQTNDSVSDAENAVFVGEGVLQDDDSPTTALLARGLVLLKCSAVATSILNQLSPMGIILRVSRLRNTGELDGLQFLTILASACIWMLYGLLKPDTAIALTNVTALILGGYYVSTYHSHCKNRYYRAYLEFYYKIASFLLVAVSLFVIVFGASFAMSYIGIVGVMMSTIAYAAPLAAVRVVLRDKSSATMPAEVCIGNFTCAALWVAYGSAMRDKYIITPNMFGALVGSLQIGILIVYPPAYVKGIGNPVTYFLNSKNSSRRTSYGADSIDTKRSTISGSVDGSTLGDSISDTDTFCSSHVTHEHVI